MSCWYLNAVSMKVSLLNLRTKSRTELWASSPPYDAESMYEYFVFYFHCLTHFFT